MTDKEQAAYDAITPPAADAGFRLAHATTFSIPHPYCITAEHVAIASDHYGGMLGERAIEGAERSGVTCGMRDCNLPYDEHTSQLAAVIVLPDDHPKDLNAVPGLHAWLLSVKDAATQAGIEGFAFPTERQAAREARNG